MKKIIPIFFVLALATMSFQCGKEPCCDYPVGTLNMNFKAIYANKPLIINQIYDYNGKKVQFSRLQFFLTSDINYFTQTTSQSDRIPTANLVNFTDLDDSLKAAKGVLLPMLVPSGVHTSMNFDIGISKTLNAKTPKNFIFPDGMADNGNYWEDWKSYIFVKLEGKIDKDGDGTFETGITLHTGGDDALKTLQFTKNYEVQNLKTTSVDFELNINELVKNIDLTTVNSTHQVGSTAVMKVMMGNFQTALTVK